MYLTFSYSRKTKSANQSFTVRHHKKTLLWRFRIQMKIPFNRIFTTGDELENIKEAIAAGRLAGNGNFTERCIRFVQEKDGFPHAFLTSSCTAALEMAAILTDVGPGDEVIMPSYTYPGTANAFILRGADVVFADSMHDHPNIDPNSIRSLLSPRTKAIVAVHYGGVSCDMNAIMEIADEHGLFIIEDAAQAIDGYYKRSDGTRIALGRIGHFGAFSFHQTKNITSGEGGMLVVNDSRLAERAEIILQNGTNKSAFSRGEATKYLWMDKGSSFLPSELTAAFLYAQLCRLDEIQSKRLILWNEYFSAFRKTGEEFFKIPQIPFYADHNAHIFYLVCNNPATRDGLLKHLEKHGIQAAFHYFALHRSPYFIDKHRGHELNNALKFERCLLRLPLHHQMEISDIRTVCEAVLGYFQPDHLRGISSRADSPQSYGFPDPPLAP